MSEYKPRLSAPATNNKNYIHESSGGYNLCIEIKHGSCLPNCVGYAWGRWREFLGKNPSLSRRNAEMWYSYTADGYKRGKTPKLGAVICWGKGKVGNESDGAGHVGIVEVINNATKEIVVSMSAYNGTRFFTRTFKIGSYDYNGFDFQGFIYSPVEFEDDTPKYSTGYYRVTDASVLNVRTGPGTEYSKKKYKEFTKNARDQIYQLVRYQAPGYVMGVEFTVSEVVDNWGKTPSGWVCLDYCTKI